MSGIIPSHLSSISDLRDIRVIRGISLEPPRIVV
ncbi:hypothetical protein VPHK567_0095 [Vibrio phage K567]